MFDGFFGKILAYLFVYGIPAVVIGVGAAAGCFLLRHASRRRDAYLLAWGAGVAGGALATAIGILALAIYFERQQSWGGFGTLLLPQFSAQGLLGSSVAALCVAFVCLWLRRESMEAAGWSRLPHVGEAVVSGGLLLAASAAGSHAAFEEWVVPRWRIWPYRALGADSRYTQLTLEGWKGSGRGSDEIIRLDGKDATNWYISFSLDSVDENRDIEVKLQPRSGDPRNVVLHRIPFEVSSYVVTSDGELRRVD